MERYEAYKDSGVEWIGEIPRHWSISKGTRALRIRYGYPFESSRFSNTEGWPLIRIRDVGLSATETLYDGEFVESARIENGDILVGMDGEYKVARWKGQTALLNQRVCSLEDSDVLSKDYLLYLMPEALRLINELTYGTTVKHLGAKDLNAMSLVCPPIDEQQTIANYLDTKTAEIDALVADCEREVELLQEYRKAVISEAVTKGLDPDAPMKDSGVDWIGEIPEGWKCCRVKQVARISSGATPNRDDYSYWNGSVPWVKTGELQNALICESEEYITETALDETSVQLYPAGTILMAMYGQGKTRGMTGMLVMASTTNQACAAIQVYTADDPSFIWKALIAGYDAIRDVALGSGQPNLNAELVGNFHIPLPNSVEEQSRIVAGIDTKTAEIDFLIESKQSMADKLREYRRSLISEAVTGKFKVPGV